MKIKVSGLRISLSALRKRRTHLYRVPPSDCGSGRFVVKGGGKGSKGEVAMKSIRKELWFNIPTQRGFVNITVQVHRPFQPGINSAYSFKEDWRSYANTPGHAMQFTNGLYRGRILVAANHSSGNPLKDWGDYASHVFYTDDHGITFRLGQTLQIPGSNEASASEISGNGLILSARNQKGDVKARIVALSANGGETWDSIWTDKFLPDPVCEGSILPVGEENGKFILAFCNPASTKNRDYLTLRISHDEGRTWTTIILVDRSSDPRNSADYAAYSDIVKISPDEIGVLYERDNYSRIVFKVIKWK